MTDPLSVPPASLRTVWVFQVDLPPEQAQALVEDKELGCPGLRDALGLDDLDPDHVELFEAEVLKDQGLAHYLVEANGMDEKGVAPDAARLEALTGPVLLVFSRALKDGADRLEPTWFLKPVGRYSETADMSIAPPLRSDAAQGVLDAPPRTKPSDAAMSGRIAMIALLVLFLLVLVMIWIAA